MIRTGTVTPSLIPGVYIKLFWYYNVYKGESMSESSVLTLRLDARLKKQLDRLSKSMNRTRSFVAAEAIREYVELNEWQIEQVKKCLSDTTA